MIKFGYLKESTHCRRIRNKFSSEFHHYEIFKDGQRINPINFYYGNLSPEEFDVILQKAQLENQSLD